jgi:hypothetical protein
MAKGKSSGGSKPSGQAHSAITGRFVTRKYAASHPKTTFVSRPKKK